MVVPAKVSDNLPIDLAHDSNDADDGHGELVGQGVEARLRNVINKFCAVKNLLTVSALFLAFRVIPVWNMFYQYTFRFIWTM